MLRLLHTADIHLGARHSDLGEQAAAHRERQFAAFGRSVDLALEERVDLFLIAGDLFDSRPVWWRLQLFRVIYAFCALRDFGGWNRERKYRLAQARTEFKGGTTPVDPA